MTEQAPAFPSLGKANRNERRKAAATTLNAASVAVGVSVILQPLTSGHLDIARAVLAAGVFIVLQILLHYVLARVED